MRVYESIGMVQSKYGDGVRVIKIDKHGQLWTTINRTTFKVYEHEDIGLTWFKDFKKEELK